MKVNMNLSVEELCSAIGGLWPPPGKLSAGSVRSEHLEKHFTGVSIDSRSSNLKGKVFFAIKGKHCDGHDFIKEAVQKQASALVVHSVKNISLKQQNIPIIQTQDTTQALQKLSVYWRKKNPLKIIGITGSSGKTTTKYFCKTLMEQDFKVLASPKSYNNIYGVCLTLLSASPSSSELSFKTSPYYIIQEMGMNHAGEIKTLCQIAPPNIAAVVHVGSSHIGCLGGIKNIAEEKQQIYKYSLPEAVHVYNLDNIYTKAMYDSFKGKRKTALVFSCQNEKADVFLKLDKTSAEGLHLSGRFHGVKGSVVLPIAGAVNLNNLMCACALALSAGLKPEKLWDRLFLCRLPAGRLQWVNLPNTSRALFDAYNASPESVFAMLDYFLSLPVKGDKALVLGDCLELGSYLSEFHKQLADKLVSASSPAALLCWIGDQAQMFKMALDKRGWKGKLILSKSFDLKLAKKITSLLNPSSAIAFKASRKMKLEKFLMQFNPVDFNNPF